MIQDVYDERGKRISNPEHFYSLLHTDYQVTSKIELLDTDFNPVNGGTIFSADKDNELTNFITDGNVDIDTTRGTRRTAQLTLLNPTAEFTPALDDFDPEGPWVGKIYLNRVVRMFRGLYSGGQALYVPIGTFYIDVSNVVVERNMSQVNLTMSDGWKKLTKSMWGDPHTYHAGHHYNDIISDIVQRAGANQPLTPVYDSLKDRSLDDQTVGWKISVKPGDSMGDTLKKLCGDWDIDAFFDPMGRFTTQDRRDAKEKPPSWAVYSSHDKGNLYSAESRGNLISLQRSFNDDSLYNHVIVVGKQFHKYQIRIEKKDTDPRSKFNVGNIGDRVKMYQSDKITNHNQARRALERLWKLRVQLSEENDIECICNPGLEGDDIITLTEKTYAKVDGKYRLQAFNVPLVTSRQQMKLVNVVRGDDL